jgi:hypothetical protein
MAQREKDVDVMRYADGEVSGAESDRLKNYIDGDVQAREVVGGIRELGGLLRTHLEIETDRVEQNKFDRVWADIQRATQAPQRASRESAAITNPVPIKHGLRSRWDAWWENFHGHVLTGAATAAAVLLLVIAIRPFEREVEKTVTVEIPAPPVAIMPASQPPEIENLEIYQGTGMILTVPGEGGDAPTAVIWLNSNQDIAEGPL